MMRPFLCYSILFFMLLAGVDKALDMVSEGHPQGNDLVHLLDAGDHDPDQSVQGDHCEHCCHGHQSGIALIGPFGMSMTRCDQHPINVLLSRKAGKAPPTPPPTA